jgi:mRNA-degrading endonuclease RelE of RelBE toxin-antitoxin system
MSWTVRYHPAVAGDLRALGRAEAAAIMEAIDSRIYHGRPHLIGKALGGELAGCRRLRVAANRVVYRVDLRNKEVFILAIGPRRRGEVCKESGRRI